MAKLNIQVYDGQITPHFNISEFRCPAKGEVLINSEVLNHIQRLEKFRVWYDRPMSINSGYRTKEYNDKLDGASPNSQHINGIACDIALPNEFYSFTNERKLQFLDHIKRKWYEICSIDNVGGGVGFYDTFFHLDSRKTQSFWNERSK